jgi:hypothetical protein
VRELSRERACPCLKICAEGDYPSHVRWGSRSNDQIDGGNGRQYLAASKLSKSPAQSVPGNVRLSVERDDQAQPRMPEIVSTPTDIYSGCTATAAGALNRCQI